MTDIIIKADRKAKKAMDGILERSERYSSIKDKHSWRRYWRNKYLREFWKYSYIISESQAGTFITAFNASPQKTLLSSEDTSRLIVEIDRYLERWEQSIDEALLAFSAEKQAREMMRTTAMILIGDVYDENGKINFILKQQKNGRVCCTLLGPNYWNQRKLFRTTWENFREDFIKAYKEFNHRLNTRFYTL